MKRRRMVERLKEPLYNLFKNENFTVEELIRYTPEDLRKSLLSCFKRDLKYVETGKYKDRGYKNNIEWSITTDNAVSIISTLRTQYEKGMNKTEYYNFMRRCRAVESSMLAEKRTHESWRNG